jgi:hypothetical protein
MPGQDGELAGDGDDRDGVTAPTGDPGVERVEGARHPSGAEGGLDEQTPDVSLAGVADVAGVGGPAARLADDRVKPEVADELVRPRIGQRLGTPLSDTR